MILTTKAARDICKTHDEYCVGANVQYNSTGECIDFIMNKVPFGDIWQAGQNTGNYSISCDGFGVKWSFQEYVVICITRWYEESILHHIKLRCFFQVPRRPSVHCPHIGPDGGDMCTKRDVRYLLYHLSGI